MELTGAQAIGTKLATFWTPLYLKAKADRIKLTSNKEIAKIKK